MTQTLRVFYHPTAAGHGRLRKNINWGPINHKSVVLITASEALDLTPTIGDPLDAIGRHLGDADVWVSNISPHEGGVEFILHVDWPSSLNIVVDITVLDSPVTFLGL